MKAYLKSQGLHEFGRRDDEVLIDVTLGIED